MTQEKSCVHPFIKRTQLVFANGGSLSQALKEIATYQEKVSRVYKVDVYLIHAIAVSRFGLGAVVVNEYLRSKGYPLPDTLAAANKLTSIKSFSERLVLRNKDDSARHEMIERACKD